MVFDIIFLIILAWAGYRGYTKGLVVQASLLAALILGIFGAIRFSGLTAKLILQHTTFQSDYLSLISFAITFVVIVILVHILAKLLERLIEAVALGFINRLLGIAFSVLKSAFIISIALVVLNTIHYNRPFLPEKEIDKSILYRPLSSLAPMIFPYLRFNIPKNQQLPGNPNDVRV